MATTPATLLEKLRTAPDPEAWGRFVELYTPLLLSWAYRMGLPGAEAADLVQEVFLHLVQKLPGFVHDPRRRFRAWLRTVAQNLWRNGVARRRPTLAGEMDLDGLAAPEEEAFWEADYRRHLVERALAVMRAEFQPATWMACWEVAVNGRPAEEVGAELGMSAGAVRAARYRVINRLRQELDGLID